MIGSGLKKLAAENGMQVSKGVAYGSLRGYAATLSEGAGWKQIAFSTMLVDNAQRGAFDAVLDKIDLRSTYRVNRLIFSAKNLVVIFQDNPGTMKKSRNFWIGLYLCLINMVQQRWASALSAADR